MKILIIGSGGREHVLTWKIKQSSLVKKIYCAPGNGGMAQIAECVDLKDTDIPGLLKFAKEKKIDLTVVGPEAPLVLGIVDVFEKEGLKIFGPAKAAAQLEGSKVFAKEFMHKYGIPTAPFRIFSDSKSAKDFLTRSRFPLVVKADGLAAGKGVVICKTLEEANCAVDQIMQERIFKEAGDKIIIEDCLLGEEVSILAMSDGENYVVLESAQDHKRIFDDDLGPNTGGMGAYSPAPIATLQVIDEVEKRVIEPVIAGMREEGTPFKGILYAGIMMTAMGPMVLEFNTRFGDPETQAIIPRLKNDLVELMHGSCEGQLNDVELIWDKRPCVCVVMSSGGYPGKYETGKEITGLEQFDHDSRGFVFHAGTKKEGEKILTSGGRVLGVTSLGNDVEDAIKNAYEMVEKIHFDRCFFRRDIGAKALRKTNVVGRL
ncbi:MAG: phosphoribosylamine--glycine ligase [Candidatus Omnitrophica bacterium]|nr:phosphoribosylamine--glycine ligase [Candidatus Omnitrophota bacterium]